MVEKWVNKIGQCLKEINFLWEVFPKCKGEKVEKEGFEYEVWDDNQGGWCDEARLPPGVRPLCSGEL